MFTEEFDKFAEKTLLSIGKVDRITDKPNKVEVLILRSHFLELLSLYNEHIISSEGRGEGRYKELLSTFNPVQNGTK